MDSVQICNIALAHLGDRRITRLDADAQESDAIVRYCADFLPLARGEVLEAQRWTFAKKDVVLNRTSAPIMDYTYAHVLPTDIIRLLNLVPGAPDAEDDTAVYFNGKVRRYKIIGEQIHSNTEHMALRYIYDVEDANLWSKGVVACVSRLLASYLAGPLADSPSIAESHRMHYERIDLPNAQYLDAVQDESNENNDNITRLAGSGLVRAGRSEYFEQDFWEDDTGTEGSAGGTSGGTIIGDGSVIG